MPSKQSGILTIVEQFNEKAKARKAMVTKPNKLGKRGMTTIRMNGEGSHGPALVIQGCSNGTAPKKGRLLRSQTYDFQNTMSVTRLTKIASNRHLC